MMARSAHSSCSVVAGGGRYSASSLAVLERLKGDFPTSRRRANGEKKRRRKGKGVEIVLDILNWKTGILSGCGGGRDMKLE